jgi:hypothetical protein
MNNFNKFDSFTNKKVFQIFTLYSPSAGLFIMFLTPQLAVKFATYNWRFQLTVRHLVLIVWTNYKAYSSRWLFRTVASGTFLSSMPFFDVMENAPL